MSHWTVCKVEIKNPDVALLRRAMEVLAKELHSYVAEDFVVTGWRGSQRCLFAIPKHLPWGNGYGVYIDEQGYLRVVVDDHGAPMSAREFAQRLTQLYITAAVATAAQRLGFTVSAPRELSEGILLELAR